MGVYATAPQIGFPPPAHTLTAGAEAARIAVREYAHNRRLKREAETMVTRHGRPPFRAAPASAEALRTKANVKGFEVRVALGIRVMNPGKANERNASAWTVAGKDGLKGVGFRCVWVDGKASEGTWYSADGGEDCGIAEVAKRVREL